VPREQAGTAGGALITAQRLGAAIGIAVIGTALFGAGGSSGGSGSGGSGSHAMPSLVTNAQHATIVNLVFVAAAFACTFGLPRRLAGTGGQERPPVDDREADEDLHRRDAA
jgi:hypothetical protein